MEEGSAAGGEWLVGMEAQSGAVRLGNLHIVVGLGVMGTGAE